MTLGDQDDIATRLKFRAGIDTGTWRSYARLGFRTERIQPLNLKDGVTLRRRLPLDGTEGHAKLEVRANLCLPEPEVRREACSVGVLLLDVVTRWGVAGWLAL